MPPVPTIIVPRGQGARADRVAGRGSQPATGEHSLVGT
jgi:hypothetical protein